MMKRYFRLYVLGLFTAVNTNQERNCVEASSTWGRWDIFLPEVDAGQSHEQNGSNLSGPPTWSRVGTLSQSNREVP